MVPIRYAFLALAALAAPVSAQAGPARLELVTVAGHAVILSDPELEGLPRSEVSVNDGASAVVYGGPSMRELLTRMGAPTGRALRGPAMSLIVLAEAADGYSVAFTVSELDPQFGDREAVVALTQGGGPLSERDGPLQLVLPQDECHARWVRQLIRLRLVQMPAAAASPAHP